MLALLGPAIEKLKYHQVKLLYNEVYRRSPQISIFCFLVYQNIWLHQYYRFVLTEYRSYFDHWLLSNPHQ